MGKAIAPDAPMPDFPSLVVAANIFLAPSAAFTPNIPSVAAVGLACPNCYPASHDAGGRPYFLGVAINAKPAALDEAIARVAGNNVGVNIKKWHMPTLRSHPHDPLVTSDGAIWYTGQIANLLGWLDPGTGNLALACGGVDTVALVEITK